VHPAESVREYLSGSGPFYLEIGAGPVLRPGWLSTDLQERPAADGASVMTLDATQVFPLPNDSFDCVYSEHMIEHITFNAGQNMLREAHRILKPGGVIRIATPSIGMLLRMMSPDRTLLEETYFHQSVKWFVPDAPAATNAFFLNNFMRNWGHTFIYDRETLRLALGMAGFADIVECRFKESRHAALNGLENESRLPPGFLELETMIFEGTK
jgi:predicted SAM-dependent methyltransferase